MKTSFCVWQALLVPTVLGWLGLVPAARADDRVDVTVIAIFASDRHNHVAEKLKCIAEKVQKAEPTLTGFEFGPITKASMIIGKTYTVPIVDKQVAEVVVERGADKNERVKLKVKPPKMGEVTYSGCCGKFFPLITRYQTKNGERLILAVMVKPCKKKS